MISVRTIIFDTKEQTNNYAFHSLQGILMIMKGIHKVDGELYQEIIELNLRYMVFFKKIIKFFFYFGSLIFFFRMLMDLKKHERT